MSYGPLSKFEKTMASGGTSTGAIDLARSWKMVYLEIPSMTSNTQIYINASSDDETYRYTYHPMSNAAAPTGNRFLINSAVTNAMVPIPNGFRYIKVETTATVDGSCLFKVVCSD